MNPVRFDPEAKEEFLEAILYYEECQNGLGRGFELPLSLPLSKFQTHHSYIGFCKHHLGVIWFQGSLTTSFIQLNLIIFESLRLLT